MLLTLLLNILPEVPPTRPPSVCELQIQAEPSVKHDGVSCEPQTLPKQKDAKNQVQRNVWWLQSLGTLGLSGDYTAILLYNNQPNILSFPPNLIFLKVFFIIPNLSEVLQPIKERGRGKAGWADNYCEETSVCFHQCHEEVLNLATYTPTPHLSHKRAGPSDPFSCNPLFQ